jgi:hypothetical protein
LIFITPLHFFISFAISHYYISIFALSDFAIFAAILLPLPYDTFFFFRYWLHFTLIDSFSFFRHFSQASSPFSPLSHAISIAAAFFASRFSSLLPSPR